MAFNHRLTYLAWVVGLILVAQAAVARADGDGGVTVTGELKQWHKVTLTIDGPFARETDTDPNPFTDYRLTVRFTHEEGGQSYVVPGYFAADGNAGQTSAKAGNKWRAHFAPDRPGRWTYAISFVQHPGIALRTEAEYLASQQIVKAVPVRDNRGNSFLVAESDKAGRDLRAHGRLEYVGERYLRFAGSGDYFLKAGADAPETLLAYADFDDTTAPKNNAPLKTYAAHVRDWQQGDPTWQNGRGKGLVGAINYLSSTGCNAFSFLTYNAGGDGDNVWPFIERGKKMHYDCSKLDQWQAVFDHATTKGMYLHFKLQETENDDNRRGWKKNNADVPAALDGGDLGPQRRLYLREMVARFGHNLALNWNLGEENTQTTKQQRDMAAYLGAVDPYGHHIVIHTYPNQQDAVYGALLGDQSLVTGASLQNSDVRDCHAHTLKWVRRSKEAGKPWVVAFDEPGEASFGTPPDPDWPGMEKFKDLPATVDDVRKHALWGTLMAGGAGVEYYFGYKLPQNDLDCEDWRSRAQTWEYSAIALRFFRDHAIPYWEMDSRDELIGADPTKNSGYCLAKPGELYLVYLPQTRSSVEIDLSDARGALTVHWFNPRQGGKLIPAGKIDAGGKAALPTLPESNKNNDWLAVIRKAD
ncbi:MAG: DUF5060 domain-containing protein [Phycisphaeraceae bacterium]